MSSAFPLRSVLFAVALFATAAHAQTAASPPASVSPQSAVPSAGGPIDTISPTQTAPAQVGRPASAAEPDAIARDDATEVGTKVANAVGMHELSPWSMFLSADIVVKIVMCGLAFASLVTWTVLLAKTAELLRARRGLGLSLKRIETARTLREAQTLLGPQRNVLSKFVAAALLEARLSQEADAGSETGIKERAASCFTEITRSEARGARRGMGLLATIGSTAPFVGLFGTVWGIMNSFIGISKSQTTNLAVVAPGIAEALLATAIGLVAAIPAVIIYNHFSRQVRSYLDVASAASGAAGRLLSRDLDRMQDHPLVQAAE